MYDDPAASPPPGKHFLIPGPSGVLEALLDMPGTPHATGAPIAVVCHPHPLYGGSLTNKVAHTVARAFASMGAQTLRFNFRGVGESMGSFDEGRGEVDDLLAAEAWLRVRRPGAPLWLAGFSFGAFVALSGHVRAGAQSLLLVAPPVAMFDFPAESGVSIPWLVIQGSDDEVVDPAQVSAWARQQVNPPEFICLDGAGHFFHRRLIDLRDQIQAHWPPQ
ncbi:MAG TPA: alpha/beta hydrolase [Gammaproteobacteria bacterium]|nr:alpha/beta hydrolase [Gammaproteobacteria bacterium]